MGSGDTHKAILTPMNADHKRRDNKQSALSAGLSSLPVATSVVAAGVLAFLSGGYMLGLSAPAVVVFLVAAAACVWLVREWSRPSPLFLGALVSLAAFAFWTGLSVLWSFGPDLTWVGFNVTALYLAVLAIVGLSPVRAVQLRVAGAGFLAVCVAVATYAFLGKALPDVVTHAHQYARLASPVGYWNALALLMIMGLVIALALAGDAGSRLAWRALAAAAAVPLTFTFFFCFSRGGWIVLVIALGVYFCLTTTRLASFASLVLVSTPVALVLWRLRGLETLFTETTNDALRASQGSVLMRWSIVALLVAVGLQAAVVLVQKAVRWPRWSVVAAGVMLIVVLAGGTTAFAARYLADRGGLSWVESRARTLVNDSDTTLAGGNPGRLGSLNTGRPPLWREALHQSAYDRVKGTGAGTFPFTHYRFRDSAGVVKHAHSQWLNVLSELGVVGLALFIAAALLLVAAAMRNPLARRRDPMHPLLVAMLAAVVAFFVHISWDWEWDMAAVGVAVFLLLGASIAYRASRAADERFAGAPSTSADEGGGREETRVPRHWAAGWAPRVVASAALVLLAVSWLPPYLADRAEHSAVIAASKGDTAAALVDARSASSLNPLAAEPLLTEAQVLQQTGQTHEALTRLRQAARLQPENFRVWYQLGLLQANVLGRKAAARASFRRALGLNPLDTSSRYELTLVGG